MPGFTNTSARAQQWKAPRRAAAGALGLLGLGLVPGLRQAYSGRRAEAAEASYALTVNPPAEIAAPTTPAHPAYTVYTPQTLVGAPPAPVTVLVLHGIGGNGPGMAASLLPVARAQGWTVVAPTIPYGDWRDPAQLTREELALQPQMAGLLDAVPAETGVALGQRVLIFGFSRGAQTALRFAMLYPDRVRAVAACSAGTYTLPTATIKTASGGTMAAPLPFGVADMEQQVGHKLDAARFAAVRVLIGVGANDNREGDVPRQWDPFVGKTRVERAERFAASLTEMGMPAKMVVVPATGHELTPPMVEQVTSFLTGAAAEQQAQQAAATTTEAATLPLAGVRS
ncbi:MAG TPA: alpha/beta fold hydrolase [Chloroflexota bacterium]|nr:alpha/beta fold hydrolase [Chloroflexota bacterium]